MSNLKDVRLRALMKPIDITPETYPSIPGISKVKQPRSTNRSTQWMCMTSIELNGDNIGLQGAAHSNLSAPFRLVDSDFCPRVYLYITAYKIITQDKLHATNLPRHCALKPQDMSLKKYVITLANAELKRKK